MSNESGINDSSNTVRGFRLFNNLGRFVLQQHDNNQGLVGAILRQRPHISQNFELPQEMQRNVVPRLSDNDDVSLARRRQNAQCVASLRRLESTDQANNRRHNDAVRHAARRNAESAQQTRNRQVMDAQRHVVARQLESNEQAANRRAENAHRQAMAREMHNAPYYNIARQNVLPNLYFLGAMDKKCDYCQALKFENENCFKCCHTGKSNIRKYNSAVAFASFGANFRPPPGRGPPCFRICGQIWHRVGGLHPPEGQTPVFNQLYIYEAGRALNERMARQENNGCREDVMRTVQDVMDRVSPFAAAYRYMAEVEAEELNQAAAQNRAPSEVRMYMRVGNDRKRYNLPHHDEVAAVFVGQDGAPPGNRDVVIYPRGGDLQNISTMSANLDPMVYPLFFPRGEPGWHNRIPHVAVRATRTRNTTTMLQYYTYRLAAREYFSPIHYGKKLFQQYCVDSYVKFEGNNLNYIRANQTNLRVDSYEGLADHLNARAEERGLQPGRIVVLPSSFQGSPRAMAQNYQDAMAVIGKFGKPDFFLTFTCNPKWREITENLFAGQRAHDRPDLVSRVFKLKLNELLKDVTEMGVLGKTIAHVYVIEFQKRGLPHCHLLIHLDPNDKLRDADDIDSVISAEIPNQQEHPELFEVVRSCMIHGSCGHLNPNSRCMEDGVCTKSFSKNFLASTVAEVNGYPLYRRRDNGIHINVNNVDVDNRWIVPYNPWLSKKYNAHINLEACMSVKSVKYLYKYIYKGHDCANIEINERIDHDEVQTFLDARYVSAPEAIWRLFEFTMHQQSHVVHRLPVHLPKNHIVYFQQGQAEEALDRAADQATKLTAWFVLNAENHDARQYMYPDIPLHFVFNKNKVWKPRQRGHDDTEWNNTLQEAVNFQMPRQLRQLFAVILTHCEPSDPFTLWTRYKDAMYEDYIRQMNEEHAEYRLLQDINSVLRRSFQVGTAAFTGIAATLLKKGTTIHRLFRLPVPIVENSTCKITPVSAYAAELRQKSLFLLDEASMIPKHAFHAIDRLLQDICNNELPFGGKVVLLGGNFSQLLPVVRKGKATEIVDMCLKSSPLWHLVKEFRLHRNMRTRPGEQQFAAWLLQLGKGVLPVREQEPFQGAIEVPSQCVIQNECIVDTLFRNLSPEIMASSVVLTPTNDDSLTINDQVLALLPGEEKVFFSADDVVCDEEEERNQYPVEFLNSITPSGMPPHCLKLKTGAIVMLLRNINMNNGLCNGTRLIIRRLHDNCVDAEVLTGNAIGDRVLIPRVQLAPSDTGMPFVLRRRQLPLRLSYAMSINKAQGQTFEKVGILLRRPCFSHGQLYVAFSRARAFGDVRVSVVPSSRQGFFNRECYTQNVVYRQVLT
ncbi:uncharacterized protein LOC130630262 [Hydractinia symbiolongicarpus]|uniref:uncharacterized protein LOC130630262 n=1 Tax=Hydractinia symbiolongicarpus TaxID=13093 RepID=UPI00254C4E38|nr:uncharacterized protein LOC130630262 [Hydractinia symbiolongicarpus]